MYSKEYIEYLKSFDYLDTIRKQQETNMTTTTKKPKRPNAWITGTDELTHDQYRAYVQSRAQTTYRNESWELSFEEYQTHWADHWHQRGRKRDAYVLTRIDPNLPWSNDNVTTMRRYELFEKTADHRRIKHGLVSRKHK